MEKNKLIFLIGQHLSLTGHFDVPVLLEEARPLSSDDSASYECRVRLPNGSLEETVVSADEVTMLVNKKTVQAETVKPVEAEKLRLLIESARIRLAYAHDRQFAVSLSAIRTLPHQIEAVYQAMLPQPRLRFLLADDPGAGKTIMAGLLVKELKLREAIERILILSPAPLTIQWQDELQRWFGESFDIIFSAVDQKQLTNPWQRSSQIIASIDYGKQEDVRERIWQQHWDLVIIDEAHKCSARTSSGGQGREPRIVTTRRYDLVFKLSALADHILLLTATPHHGDEDKFAHFLRLIDPDLFPEPHRLGNQATAIRKDIFRLGKNSPWSLRRLKEDLKDVNGKRLFPDRHTKTIAFSLNSDEYAIYKNVTAYINEFLPQQTGQRRSSAALARTVLQRRLVSSACAMHESIKRRLKKQQDLLEELEGLSPGQRTKRLEILQGRLPDIEQEEDDLDDTDRDQLADEYTTALELEQLRTEISALKELLAQAQQVRERANDSKLAALKKCLNEAQFWELKDGRGKLLIFTEHRDTLNYVRDHLERQQFAQICHEYLEKSFALRIKRAQERAMLLLAEVSTKPEYRLTADEAQKYVTELERTRKERLSGLERLSIARTGSIKYVGTAIVLTSKTDARTQLSEVTEDTDPIIQRQSEIAAEEKVIASLIAEGFPPDRVERIGHLKLGFDIRAHKITDEATGEILVKRIEVKGRRRGQPVRLTTNEWYKAQQLAETYWLYVVWDPLGNSPELVRIQNPAAKLDYAKREIVAARFYEIPADAINITILDTEKEKNREICFS